MQGGSDSVCTNGRTLHQSENERIFFETLNIMRSTKTLAHIGICYWMNVTTRKIIANHMIGTC